MNYTATIRSLEDCLYVDTNNESVYKNFLTKTPEKFIPNYSVSKREEGNNIQDVLKYNVDGKFNFRMSDSENRRKIEVHVKEFSQYEPIFLANQILEVSRQIRGVYTIHSSSVSRGDGGVIIVGESGSGKSRLANHFYKNGFDFISNENTILDPLKSTIVGGTHMMSFREDYENELNGSVEKITRSDGKISYLKDMSKFARKNPTKIEIILVPQITDDEKFIASKISREEINYRICNSATHIIRGVETYLNNFGSSAPSMDSETISARRTRNIFSMKIDSYFVRGNLDSVMKFVSGLI